MLNAICITTNQLEHIQTNLCIHLSYLEDQRNLKIYNKNILKKEKKKKKVPLSHYSKYAYFLTILVCISLRMYISVLIRPAHLYNDYDYDKREYILNYNYS